MSSMTMRARTAFISLFAMLTLLLSGVIGVEPASAASRDGACNSGEFCYYYNSDEAGAISDFTTSVSDYGTTEPSCYDFKGTAAGHGTCIKNNAASVWNRSSKTVRVYYNTGYAGSFQDFAAGAKGNLNATLKNNNASHQFLASSPPTGCSTDGTNTKLPTTILVYRVSLDTVVRVDFKTYVENVLPNEWISSWPAESLKAGAMAVKSYGWYWALHSTRKTSGGACFDVYDNTSSQVYRPGSATAATNAAANATWGTRMTRGGDILQAQYCSTSTACGGWTTGNWMSQYGSRDLANDGDSYATILHHYYANIVLTG